MAPKEVDTETGEVMEVSVLDTSEMAAVERASVDSQVATANLYPRSITKFVEELETIATRNPEIAKGCAYSKPRGGKSIVGPSVRLAEMVQATYRNINVEVQERPIDRVAGRVRVVGTARDMEKNVAVRVQVSRSIKNKRGELYPDHMIETTIAAAQSIAFRNAIFRIVPRALWEEVYEKTKKVALGEGLTSAQRIEKALEYVKAGGYDLGAVESWVGARHEDWTLDDLTALRLRFEAVRDGAVSKADAFPPDEEAERLADDEEATAVSQKISAAAKARAKPAAKAKAAKAKAKEKPEPTDEPSEDEKQAIIAAEKREAEADAEADDDDNPFDE